MALVTLTTNGTAYPMMTRGTTAADILPSQQWCASLNIQIISVGGTSILTTPSTAVVCLGFQKPSGTAGSVTTSAFDVRLDGTTNTSYTFSLGGECNDIDLSRTYAVSDTNAVVIAINPRVV